MSVHIGDDSLSLAVSLIAHYSAVSVHHNKGSKAHVDNKTDAVSIFSSIVSHSHSPSPLLSFESSTPSKDWIVSIEKAKFELNDGIIIEADSSLLKNTYLFSPSQLSPADFLFYSLLSSSSSLSATLNYYPNVARWFDLLQNDKKIKTWAHYKHAENAVKHNDSLFTIDHSSFIESNNSSASTPSGHGASKKDDKTKKESNTAAAGEKTEKKDNNKKDENKKGKEEKKEDKKDDKKGKEDNKKGKEENKRGGGKEEKKGGAVPAVYRLDIRVGRVLSVENHPTESHMYVEKIDFAENEPRQVVSGIANFVKKEDFVGKLIVALVNVKAAEVKGAMSAGVVLVATSTDGSQKELLVPPASSKPGDRITFAGVPAEQAPDAAVASKNLHEIKKSLHVNDNHHAQFADIDFMTAAGPVTVPSLTAGSIA